MWLNERDRRDGVIYDCTIKQFDIGFWNQVSGTSTMSSNKLRNNNATIASYLLMEFADLEIALNVPVVPTSGQAKKWGVYAPSPSKWNAAYFEITGTTFRAVCIGDNGDVSTSAIAWSSGVWDAHEIRYRIICENSRVQFLIEGVVVATFTDGKYLPTSPAPLYITNGNSDNLDLGYVGVRRAAGMV